jgi:hypothetical protein
MQGKDKNGQLLRLGDYVKAQIHAKWALTPLIGLLRSWGASGKILVIFLTMTGTETDWFDPSEVELDYHPEPAEPPVDVPKKREKASKAGA